MNATLDTIKSAIIAQARASRSDLGGPFKTVDNFAGNLSQSATQEMINQIFSMAPAVLIACAGETYEAGGRTGAPVTLARGSTGYVGTSTWHAYVIAMTVQSSSKITEAGTTSLGIYDLASRAVAALAGLRIDGLYRADSLDVLDSKPFWWKRDQYVWLARFTARRWLKAAEITDLSYPLETIAGTVTGMVDDEAGPIDSLLLEDDE